MSHALKFIFFSLILVSSCKSELADDTNKTTKTFSKEELSIQQAAWDEVMAIHDAIMPRMGALDKADLKLKDALKVTTDSVQITALNHGIQKIKAADKLMWDWMYALVQLKELQSKKTHIEIQNYLSKELSRIKKVKEKMDSSIQNSLELTKK